MIDHDEAEEWRALFSDSDLAAANAMLAKCRHIMTGREIEVCERIASLADSDFDEFSLTKEDVAWFSNMQTQFAREIGEWAAEEGGVA